MTIAIRPIAGVIGAEISGVDLSRLGDDLIREIRAAWLEHLVVFFREQPLSKDDFLAFAEAIGEPGLYPFLPSLENFPEIIEVKKLESETTNFGGIWHSDTVYLDEPPMASMLLAREVPPFGGDTEWASMYAAYEALSDNLKAFLGSLNAVHSSALADVSKTREDRLVEAGDDDMASQVFESVHPVVRTHPETGRKALYVKRRAHGEIRGHDRSREPAATRILVRASDASGVHLPIPLGSGFDCAVGQSLRNAQPDQRLPRLPSRDAPNHAAR